MVTDKLIYTNSAGDSIEFSTESVYHTNIRTDVKGLVSAKARVYSERVVGVDGAIETGVQIESRDIQIKGFIDTDRYGDNDEYARELSAVFNPAYTGTLRLESEKTYEIDVRMEDGPDDPSKPGDRYPDYRINLIALNPNWRLSYGKTVAISDSGTEIYYEGSKECGLEIAIAAKDDNIDMGSLTVSNGGDIRTITFRTGGGVYLVTDDEIDINTTPGYTNILLNDEVALERIEWADTVLPIVLKRGVNTISWSATGETYSASDTYAIGDIVLYDGTLYVCNTTISTPEAWTSGHWDTADLADLFDVSVTYTPLYMGV